MFVHKTGGTADRMLFAPAENVFFAGAFFLEDEQKHESEDVRNEGPFVCQSS